MADRSFLTGLPAVQKPGLGLETITGNPMEMPWTDEGILDPLAPTPLRGQSTGPIIWA
jgi:hypothetical protein